MTEGLELIERLLEQRQLAELDAHFARFLLARASRPCDELALGAALVSRATAQGHVCLYLNAPAEGALSSPVEVGSLALPEPAQWRDALLQSGVVGRPGDYQPLILDHQERLYLHRYWDYEQRLGRTLSARALSRVESVDPVSLAAQIKQLFNTAPVHGPDWQKLAAVTSLLRGLTIISGGPGTGKTTTVVKILALLRQQPGGKDLRIALAAPTGKAAARLQEAIQQARSSLPLPADLLDDIPQNASTLHRLLGVKQGDCGFHHNAENPLPMDVLILDEASMVDVALMAKLLDALPRACRLILLGDKDQLSSVESGAVLGDLCKGCNGISTAFADELSLITGEQISGLARQDKPLCDSVVMLQHSYRFGRDSRIGRLARAVNGGDAVAAEILLDQGDAHAPIGWLTSGQDVAVYAAHRYAALLQQLTANVAVEELFAQLNRFRLLCAVRQGPAGTAYLNQRVADVLQRNGLIGPEKEWYAGRPVLVTRNDYQLALYNGDIGLALPDPQRDGELAVVFQGKGQTLRWLAPARLPMHETVFAMTVHKSQGSEFAEVLLHLPERESPLLSRELLYTAITRSREKFTLSASPEVFSRSVRRSVQRNSGLADLLTRQPD